MPQMRSLGYREQALRMCIDEVAGGDIRGRALSVRFSRPVAFASMQDFLLKMDAVMDAQNFPQAFQRARRFKAASKGSPAGPLPELSGLPLTRAEVEAAQGTVTTLTVRVITRQNVTWQGHVAAPGRPDLLIFESELGFIRIVRACVAGL